MFTVAITAWLSLVQPALFKVAVDYVLSTDPGPAALPPVVTELAGAPPEGAASLTGDELERVQRNLLPIVGGVSVVLGVITVVIGLFGRYNATRITKRTQASFRKRVFEHVVRFPLHRVYGIKSGGVASILREDAGGAADLIFSLLYNPWRAINQLIGTLAILAWVDWRLLVGAVALLPAAWFTQRTWIARIRPIFRDIRLTRSRIDAHATEAFGGMRIVRGFNRERGETARFTTGNHLLARQEMLAWWWSRIIEVVWQVLVPVASAAVLLYGGAKVIDGTLTLGDLTMFSAYLLMLLGPLEALSASATSIQNQLAGLDRVLDILAEPEEFAETTRQRGHEEDGALRLAARSRVKGRISIENVSFHYPGRDELVLQDINLEIPAGTTVALVGPSGAGKTTLCNLVARFYDPTSGQILLDGVDLRDIDVNTYRSLLGIVEQDVFLFDGTVAENIGYARRGASEQDVIAAARAANAHDFITKLENGYETLIGERGVRLSGGQKQRIAIARALLADPSILILDEATSNLDSESEALIQRSLADLMRGRTSFVIAHRLSTIRHADLIVVIDHGRVIESGTHDELLARNGRYADMLRLQLAQGRDPNGTESDELESGASLPALS